MGRLHLTRADSTVLAMTNAIKLQSVCWFMNAGGLLAVKHSLSTFFNLGLLHAHACTQRGKCACVPTCPLEHA